MIFPSFGFFHSEGKIDPSAYDADKFNQNMFTPDYLNFEILSIQDEIDAVLNNAHQMAAFNGSVLVAKSGHFIYSGDFGYANFKEERLIDSHSAYQLASVSKQFTAAAIMQLYEQQQFSLEDTITTYFPELPYNTITIRQLLNHTSGLAIYFWLVEHKWDKARPPNNKEVVQLLAEYKLPQFFRSGSRFDYSNTGYILLASLIEKVSGLSYSEYLDKNIFEPLKMKDSFVYSFDRDDIRENQLAGYRRYGRRRHLEIPGTVNDGTVGDKNVYSTTEDMYRWINALNNGEVVSEASLNLMYENGITRYNRKVPYGFGFRLGYSRGEKVIYHDGKWNGFRTSVKQYEDGLTIILLEHSSYSYPSSLINKIKMIVRNNAIIDQMGS
jgi:CubicO group peptidase (beta-lactamase class C family)